MWPPGASSTRVSGSTHRRAPTSVSRVVGWSPIPNVEPGSITRTAVSAGGAAGSADVEALVALAACHRPDLVILSGMRTLPLDPSLADARVGGKAGYDLTWPFGSGGRLDMSVPEAPRFEGARFPSVLWRTPECRRCGPVPTPARADAACG